MKTLEMLKRGVEYMENEIKNTPFIAQELRAEIKIYNEAIEELEALENRSCEDCKQWVGNALFKGFCSVTGSTVDLGGCNDYFEPKQ